MIKDAGNKDEVNGAQHAGMACCLNIAP